LPGGGGVGSGTHLPSTQIYGPSPGGESTGIHFPSVFTHTLPGGGGSLGTAIEEVLKKKNKDALKSDINITLIKNR
jgi:hypothetical protein